MSESTSLPPHMKREKSPLSLGNHGCWASFALAAFCATAFTACGTNRDSAGEREQDGGRAPSVPLKVLMPDSADAGPERDAASSPTPPEVSDAGAPPTTPTSPSNSDAGRSDAGSPGAGPLLINELMASNDGAWIDELGEADDWLELVNAGEAPLELSDYRIADASGATSRLPNGTLNPGQRLLVFADDEPEQGEHHLPFKLSSSGDEVWLETDGFVTDAVVIPPLGQNQVLARFPDAAGNFESCRYASPGRRNATTCAPPPPPSLESDVEFEAYELPDPFPPTAKTLWISELALRPGTNEPAFIELLNAGQSEVSLEEFQLNLSPHKPSLPWPTTADGTNLVLPPDETLAPGERVALEVPSDVLSELESDPEFEGVLTLFDEGEVLDRVDFMRWPEGATLARVPDDSVLSRFCRNATPAAANGCEVVAERDIGDRLRALRTPADFEKLAAGASQLGIAPVKFVADFEAPGLVHLLAAARWPLHYTFVRERIYEEPELDRCDPVQYDEFYQGWVDFSNAEYRATSGRRFHLGTLVEHAGAGIASVEFSTGDSIDAAAMRDGYYSTIEHTWNPRRWVLRPQGDAQVMRVREIEGTLPIVAPNAPFMNVTYQPLTEGIAYGTLRFVTASALEDAALGSNVVVITDDVPNDIPLVGGLITEAFQTPLAHVNVLSQNRGTPNASLANARERLAPYLDELVRLEVSATGVDVELADPEEAAAFWQQRVQQGPAVAPRLDKKLRGVQPLSDHDLSSLPAIGAKAAQMAELARIDITVSYCSEPVRPTIPAQPFAIPVVHSLEHLKASGADELLDELKQDAGFVADPKTRALGLAAVRELIMQTPVDDELLSDVEEAVRERFGNRRVRFRSSSNTEDLPNFNGAGLYTSVSAELDDPERRVDDALRTVWASLWNLRAYDERAFANIDDESIAMGVLVHPASLSEEANGVAVSRNVLDPDRGDIYYINAQAGEASVTNPAPGVSTEQFVYRWGRTPRLVYHGESSLVATLSGSPDRVLSAAEADAVSCALRGVHEWFRPLLDPEQEARWFAMEIEFKLSDGDRSLLIKQARPHSFGRREFFGDCREL